MRFSDIIGQEHAKRILLNAVSTGRLPHAFIFSGTEGTGKKSLATALTMLLNCPTPISDGGCGSCKICKQIITGSFPDLHIVTPKKDKYKTSKISIDQIRDIYAKLSFVPMVKFRVIVIDHAEEMTEEASNAFLRILEEPPPNNIFILNVLEPLNLLPTIVSRCQNIKFYPVPEEKITDWLIKTKGLDSDTAVVVSKMSEGSIGKALELVENDFLKKREEWLTLLVRLPTLSKEEVLSILEELLENKDELIEILTVWRSWIRDLIVMKETSDKGLLINRDLSHMIERLSKRYLLDELMLVMSHIHEIEQSISNKNRNISLLMRRVMMELYNLSLRL